MSVVFVINTAPRLFTTSARKILYASCLLQCVLFLLRLLSCSTPYTEFSCITAPVTYVATYWSNPMRFSLSHCPVEMRGTLFWLIIVSSLPFASESCIIVANMDDKSFLQTSPDVYYNTYDTYEPPLVLRVDHPLRSMCCPYCYDRGTLPLLRPCRICPFLYYTLPPWCSSLSILSLID